MWGHRGCAGLVFAFVLWPAIATSGETIWNHNGSKIRWVSEGQKRAAYYFEPREALLAIGVKPGQMLFEGRRAGNLIEGHAYSFKRGCRPERFAVVGTVTSERDFALTGQTPVRASNGCDVVSTRDTSLPFQFIPPEEEQPSRTASVQPEASRDAERIDDVPYFEFRACNIVADETISVAIIHRKAPKSSEFIIKGWFNVESGDCKEIGTFPKGWFAFYAESKSWNWDGNFRKCVEKRRFERVMAYNTCSDSLLKKFRTRTVSNDTFNYEFRPPAGSPEAEIFGD